MKKTKSTISELLALSFLVMVMTAICYCATRSWNDADRFMDPLKLGAFVLVPTALLVVAVVVLLERLFRREMGKLVFVVILCLWVPAMVVSLLVNDPVPNLEAVGKRQAEGGDSAPSPSHC